MTKHLNYRGLFVHYGSGPMFLPNLDPVTQKRLDPTGSGSGSRSVLWIRIKIWIHNTGFNG